MKSGLQPFQVIIVFFAVFNLGQNSFAQSLLCTEQGASLAAKAYTYANAFVYKEEGYHDFIENNAAMFLNGADAESCLRRLGTVFIRIGLTQPGGHYNPEIAQERFGGMMPEGLSHLPAEVDSAINRSSQNIQGNFIVVGQSYLWLARVLAAAANGSWAPFERSDDFVFASSWQSYMQTNQYCRLGIIQLPLCDFSRQEDAAIEQENDLRALALADSATEFESKLIELINKDLERSLKSLLEMISP